MTLAKREPLAWCTGVLWTDEPLGVFARETGVFERAVEAALCCLEVLPPGGIRRIPDGEFDRVDAGLAEFEAVPTLFDKTGNREEPEECGEGECSTRRRD